MTDDEKTVYYLAISGVQKAVRRHLRPEIAVNLARVAWEFEPRALFKRLWTILMEDCGLDVKTLDAFYSWRGDYMKDFSTVVPLVKALAESQKSREVAVLGFLVMLGKDKLRPQTRDALAELGHAGICKVVDDWPSYEWDVYDSSALFGGVPEWIMDVAERSCKLDRERIGKGLPYWFSDQPKGPETTEPEDQCEEGYLAYGFLPTAALDTHTRPGKAILRRTLQTLRMGMSMDEFSAAVFHSEGWHQRNHVRNTDFDISSLFLANASVSWLTPEWIEKFKTTIRPVLDTCRREVMSASYGKIGALLQRCYENGFISC